MTQDGWHPDELGQLQRQANAALRAFFRPGTYVGLARELAMSLMHVAAFPLGINSIDALQSRLRADEAVDRIDERLDAETARMPVILVHGYFMNRSAFLVMAQALSKAGFTHVQPFNYPQYTHGLPELAAMLRVEVERCLAASGAQRCMIVGHSMGGIVARYYIQKLGGEGRVDTLITLGTPHQGTYTAQFGAGPAAWQMNYNSTLLRDLAATAQPSDLRYISYYSDLDAWVVPAVSGQLTQPALRAVNLRMRDIGHLSMLLTASVIESIVRYLSNPQLARPQDTDGVARFPGRAAARRRDQARAQPPARRRSAPPA